MKTFSLPGIKMSLLHLIFFNIVFLSVYQSCGPAGARKDSTKVDPGFSEFISGYTGGVVSVISPITIQFAQVSSRFVNAGEEITGRIFDFDPEIKGKTAWIDQYSIEFLPAGKLRQGTTYKVRLHLAELFEVPENYAVMEYSFNTIRQNFSVDIQGVYSADFADLTKQKINGIVLTADASDVGDIEKMMTAAQEGINLKLDWEHGEDQKSHRFTISGIKRSEKESGVDVSWTAEPLGIDGTGSQKVVIPSLGDFKVMNSRVVHQPRQYVALQFSDPILEKQDLSGFITSQMGSLEYIIDGNEVRVFPSVNQTGMKRIQVNRGIKNIMGYKLGTDQIIEVTFEQIKPAVRLTGKGVILPQSKDLVLPFEAVSLNAVDILITRIYENNVGQFLQVNDLGGSYELQRVGHPVARKKVMLNNMGVTDLGKWNRFTLDLSEMMKTEPGAIYQVQFGFKQNYSAYACEGLSSSAREDADQQDMEGWDDDGSETSYWDAYEDEEYYYYPSGYDWEERDNPCHVSYYTRNRYVRSNLLASDLGLMAKIGIDRNILIAVTDIVTTEPIGGVSLEVYDYQKQLIQSVTSDNKGLATFSLIRQPFLLIASRGTEKGYLKLDDGSSLSLSNFNVGGERVQQGIKGFIYGERGVWRPGDSLHLAFILEDKNNLLPDNHPVIFELFNPNGQLDHKIVRSESLNGFYNFSTRTGDDAITGNWMAKVKVGGAEFYKQVKIETIKPNRLKIELHFPTDRLAAGEDIAGDLSVKWLHGAIAANLRAVFEVSLQESQTTFPDFQDYVFDDPSRRFSSETIPVFDGRVDANGKARVPVSLKTESAAPGMLRASFKGRVYEESGDFSVDMFTMPYYPYESFVGLRTPRGDRSRGMLLTDTTHQISIATVDSEGKGISRNGIEVEIYKLDWRWWWDN
ncbi:MAG TPA: MG2 domain-containing protein, partial [Cyclobacteriaceae bacterium]|nr:MG2 domain-containing protein [Cyclobacteriaceae bacterium]